MYSEKLHSIYIIKSIRNNQTFDIFLNDILNESKSSNSSRCRRKKIAKELISGSNDGFHFYNTHTLEIFIPSPINTQKKSINMRKPKS
jgi:hypothetical protein